jgi:ATP-dependent Zn protease
VLVTAYHEAGHAVLACQLGLKFRHVTIDPREGSLGHISYVIPRWFTPANAGTDRVRHLTARYIIAAYAGGVAENKVRARRSSWSGRGDVNLIKYLSAWCDGSKRIERAFLRYCRAVAEERVCRAWRQIQSVAGALVKRRTLSSDEVASVIGEVPSKG